MKGQLHSAAKSLAYVRGQPIESEYIKDELAEIVANHEYEMQVVPQTSYIGSWVACFHGSLRKGNSNIRRIILGCGLQMWQQLTGKFSFRFPSKALPLDPSSHRKHSFLYVGTMLTPSRHQLHLLLWHHLLSTARHHLQPVLHLPHHHPRQRTLHAHLLRRHRISGPPLSAHLRRHRHDHNAIHRRHHRHHSGPRRG